MPYCIVNKIPIFLHSELYSELFSRITKEWHPVERVSAIIRDSEQQNKLERMIQKILEQDFKNDRDSFARKSQFYLIGDAARKDVAFLIHDYCHWSRLAWCYFNPEHSVLSADPYFLPTHINLSFLTRRARRWWCPFTAKGNKTIEFSFAIEDVTEIFGMLSSPCIKIGNSLLSLSDIVLAAEINQLHNL